MTLTRAHTHEELLTLARKVQAAASDGDSDRLERASLKLYDALLAHVGAERPDLVRLPPPELRVLTCGQRRVLDELAELAARAHMSGPCHCATRAADLVARLSLQATAERRALAHA
jgi:hypothetical protein